MRPLLFLLDDAVTRSWSPYLLTRPGGELLYGTFLLRERAERFWGTPCDGQLTREALAAFDEEGSPPVVPPDTLSSDQPRIVQLSRAALTGPVPELGNEAATLVLDGTAVGWWLPPGSHIPDSEILLQPRPLAGAPSINVQGDLLEAPWDLMARNATRLRRDIVSFFSGEATRDLPGSHILGDGLLSVGRDVVVEPGSVFDVSDGPIRISEGATVRSHTRLAGPAFVGPDTTILGGVLSEISLGPVCKVRGEVESTVVLGYTNKAHDGFLGHSYLGKWVNLGAFTANSDLKNNYGPVRVGSRNGSMETGLMKVGCFLGDHVKTGIGTLLNTGTVVGAGSNLFGGAMPPTYVPPFSWGSGQDLTEYRLERFLEVAAKAMGRRDVTLTAGTRSLLEQAWEQTRAERLEPHSGA